MDKKVTGFIIRRERMRRDWSQDGLCRGICAASYLSKIEQGRVEASEDILRLLCKRLELPWYGGESAMSGLSERLDELYAQAQDMSDIIEITDALYDLQWEIDSLTGANQRIDTRVALSQVSITLSEKASDEPEEAPGFVERIRRSAEDGLSTLADFLESLVLFVVWAAPWAAVLAAAALLVRLVLRLRSGGKR